MSDEAEAKVPEVLPPQEDALTEASFNHLAYASPAEIKLFITHIEDFLKTLPQVEPPLKHYHSSGGSGVYAREMTVEAGTLMTGRVHKYENLNIISKGKATVLSIDGLKHLEAPATFVASPGTKRLILAHTELVWTTILGTNESDIDKIEAEFTEESYGELRKPEQEKALIGESECHSG